MVEQWIAYGVFLVLVVLTCFAVDDVRVDASGASHRVSTSEQES